MKRFIAIALVVAAAVLAAAADRQSAAQQSQPGLTNAPIMMPSLADIMSATQWRHLKLAYSGIVSNWPLAGYELGQIQQSFAAAAQLYPVFKNVPLAQLVKDESEPPLADLAKAIEMKSSADFTHAFARLTDACNHCHRNAGVGFIVMRVPTSSPFSNQLFPPVQR
jgi:hypothetical protein